MKSLRFIQVFLLFLVGLLATCFLVPPAFAGDWTAAIPDGSVAWALGGVALASEAIAASNSKHNALHQALLTGLTAFVKIFFWKKGKYGE